MKQIFEGSRPKRHCSQVIAFEKDGALYLKCRICKRWVRLEELSLLKNCGKSKEKPILD